MAVWPCPPVFWPPGWRHALADIVGDWCLDSSRRVTARIQRTVSASASMQPWESASQRLLRLACNLMLMCFGDAAFCHWGLRLRSHTLHQKGGSACCLQPWSWEWCLLRFCSSWACWLSSATSHSWLLSHPLQAGDPVAAHGSPLLCRCCAGVAAKLTELAIPQYIGAAAAGITASSALFLSRREALADRWKQWGLLALLIFLLLCVTGINVVVSFVFRSLDNVLVAKNESAFYTQMQLFVVVLVVAVPTIAFYRFVRLSLANAWRQNLSVMILDEYFAHRAYYLLDSNSTGTKIDNPDQRISEDIETWLHLAIGELLAMKLTQWAVVRDARMLSRARRWASCSTSSDLFPTSCLSQQSFGQPRKS